VRDGRLVLAVEDDGRGFDPTASPGAGTVGMRERADLVGGTLEVDSEPGEGTRVSLVVPLGEERAGAAADGLGRIPERAVDPARVQIGESVA
jgi:glucose-6-phosphate-specific signal transduction histidine kinase